MKHRNEPNTRSEPVGRSSSRASVIQPSTRRSQASDFSPEGRSARTLSNGLCVDDEGSIGGDITTFDEQLFVTCLRSLMPRSRMLTGRKWRESLCTAIPSPKNCGPFVTGKVISNALNGCRARATSEYWNRLPPIRRKGRLRFSLLSVARFGIFAPARYRSTLKAFFRSEIISSGCSSPTERRSSPAGAIDPGPSTDALCSIRE